MGFFSNLFSSETTSAPSEEPTAKPEIPAKHAGEAIKNGDATSTGVATEKDAKDGPPASGDASRGDIPDGFSNCKPGTVKLLQDTRLHYSSRAWASFAGKNVPNFLYYGNEHKVVSISQEIWGDARNWFIIGDIHGDFYALANTVKSIISECQDFRLIFLGDLVDRGPHPMECLWFLLGLASKYPDRILWIAGNHDVGVWEDKSGGTFRSSVAPSEFLEHLNMIDSWTPFRRWFGREYIELVVGLPRAALSPDGLLITHGGFPLTDLLPALAECKSNDERIAWLNSPKSLEDFTWTRITGYPKKRPNRTSKGCSYGFLDFEAFCNATQGFFPARRLVTGHDHPEGGFDRHPEWKTLPALTLSGFAFHHEYDDTRAFNESYQDYVVVGRCREGDIPDVIQIPIDRGDLECFFAEELEPKMARLV